jgi:SAM-dependent methyltransferase
MSHREQIEFVSTVKSNFPDSFSNKQVLEIGSLDINGSVRALFSNCNYIGIDIGPGPGVDIVCQGQDYDADDNSYDTVISCEVMEHNPHWADTLRNMIRVCRPGGLVVMTCATLGRREHGTARSSSDSSPHTVSLGWNYYRNLTARDFQRENATDGLAHIFASNWLSYDLYLVGVKGNMDPCVGAKLEIVQRAYRRLHWHSLRSLRRALKSYLLDKRR